MKQITCAVQDTFDAVKFLDGIKASPEYQNAKSVLVNIFTERVQKDYISYLSGIVREKLEKARVAGLTCIQGLAHGESFRERTILTVLYFSQSEVELLEYDFSEISVDEAKNNFLEVLHKIKNLRGIQVYTTPLKNNVTNDFLSAVNFEHEDVPIFGAGAGFADTAEEQNLYIIGNKIHDNGVVITLFRGERLRIYAESTLGWTPIGKEFKITGVAENHILKTLDGEVAGEIYQNYLGVTSSQSFIENTCEFPFMLKRGDKWLARMPIKKDEEGFVHFTADIHEGEKLVFSYGSKKLILKQSFNLAEYMSRKNLDGLLLHVCRNRQLYLKDDEILEIHAFSNFYREAAGCFAFSEILYKNRSGGLQNSALVVVGFREFSADEKINEEDCYIDFYGARNFIDNKLVEDISLSKKDEIALPFEDRLVNFLHATSRDLYQANLKLEEAATTDGLTKIFNRKKISEIICGELKKKSQEKISLIMFDIDNFKRINDTYGHDMGDEVLVKIAGKAKSCIRSSDSIGRWGGEEFMILLPGAQKEEAREIAEKIRSSINAIQWEKMPAISISVGVTQVRDEEDLQDSYKRVDERLYYAKTHGKNQVCSEDIA
ncbi:GGDEF domain-containing protein [Treponema ruminis]|uniref:diguanylate cyclase n=1 Tax=Treponema ruminis TaxID=744515 RepID=A0A7W8G7Z0_9SPIR|nr:diguanylate cyclase [Treponema ruminis]MBB5225495.1 diguanylate cyclase (GGDEF)-like protein [Treponema ruminis]QSI01635.1 GGDEF domain-containing protein [Treponema ruminis]